MKPRGQKPASRAAGRGRNEPEATAGVRIIGGTFRGRKIEFAGDPRTRPMKDRTREATFNRLGPAVKGKLAIDLFAGTGALGLEALSRGAARAVLIEQHMPTARAILRTAESLGAAASVEVAAADTFLWFRRGPTLGQEPWLVFCSPPYAFYVDRADAMHELIAAMIAAAPPLSIFVVESDERFDFATLPNADEWDVREYAPAVVGILVKNDQ